MTEEEKEKKRYAQHMRQHSYGIDIEGELRKILRINYSSKEKGDYMERLQIDASECEKNPFLYIKIGLLCYITMRPNKSQAVIDFIQKYDRIADMSAYDILSFVTKDDEIDNFTLEENGEAYLERMIEDFEAIVK